MKLSKIYPPHYLVLSIVILLTFDTFISSYIFGGWIPYLGLIPMFIGIGVTGYAALQFRRAETNLVPFTESTTLVIKGLYEYTRNPMYLGMELLLIGLAIYTDTPYGWLVALIFPIVIHNLFIVKEEQQMIDTFGDDYIEYRGRVRRWI